MEIYKVRGLTSLEVDYTSAWFLLLDLLLAGSCLLKCLLLCSR